MKSIILVLAVYALIIHQSRKDDKSNVFPESNGVTAKVGNSKLPVNPDSPLEAYQYSAFQQATVSNPQLRVKKKELGPSFLSFTIVNRKN